MPESEVIEDRWTKREREREREIERERTRLSERFKNEKTKQQQ